MNLLTFYPFILTRIMLSLFLPGNAKADVG